MGDHSKSAAYSELLGYFEQHGISLADAGVSYRGLSEARAKDFLSLLAQHNVQPLGMDVWRHTSQGYEIDSPAGWYSGADNPRAAAQEATEYLSAASLGPRDIVTVQF